MRPFPFHGLDESSGGLCWRKIMPRIASCALWRTARDGKARIWAGAGLRFLAWRADTGLCERSVQRGLRALEALGVVVIGV